MRAAVSHSRCGRDQHDRLDRLVLEVLDGGVERGRRGVGDAGETDEVAASRAATSTAIIVLVGPYRWVRGVSTPITPERRVTSDRAAALRR